MVDAVLRRLSSEDAPGPHWREPALWMLLGAGAAVGAVLLVALVAMSVPAVALVVVAIGLIAIVAVGLGLATVGQASHRRADSLSRTWRAIGDALPTPCCVVDANGRAHYANAGFEALCPDCDHAPLAALCARAGAAGAGLAELAAAGRGGAVELAIPGRGEAPEWLRAAAHPLLDKPGHVLWTFEPITAAREQQEAVLGARDRLRDAVDQVPVGLYAVAADGRFEVLNRVLAEWLGTTPETALAQALRLADVVAVPPAGAAAGNPLGPGGDGGPVVLRALDGTCFDAAVTQSVVGAGPELRAAGIVRRVAPAVAVANEAVPPRATDGRHARAFEAAPMGIVLLDGRGRVVESNGAWRALVAVGSENPAGRPLSAFIAEDEADRLAAWLARVATGRGATTPLDVTLRAASADANPRIATAFPGRSVAAAGEGGDGDPGLDGLVLHFLETTEQKTLEANFTQGQKMQAVGLLAGGVAHDFNNLLTAMIGFCDLLLLRHSPGDQSFADVMQIKQNAARAANLVRHLLAFSRQQTLQPKVLNITDVLAELSNLLRRLIGAKIELEMAHGRNLDLVRVDQGQLEQVIINLAVNARDAMAGTAEGGQLTIARATLRSRRPSVATPKTCRPATMS